MSSLAISIGVNSLTLTSKQGVLRVAPFSFELTESTPACSVIGPSGSGKTTFFKSLIPRFVADWAEYGEVSIDVKMQRNGIDFLSTNGRIGYAAQAPYFVTHRTVRENLLLPFKWSRKPQPAPSSLQGVIEDFHLGPIVDRKAYQLSAGERQRLNLARMFLADPEFAIVDECLSPMDEALAADVARIIAQKYTNRARILVTGHRSNDLVHFRHQRLVFSYSDVVEDKPLRNVTVLVQ